MTATVFEKRTFLPHLRANEVLARDLFSKNGQFILTKGTLLTQSQIVRLKQFGVTELWIKVMQEETTPLKNLNTETGHAYKKAIAVIENIFACTKRENVVDVEASQFALQGLSTACKAESNFLNLIMNLRTFDDYTYQHSIGVGVLSRQIAEWMYLSESQCQEVFLAAALHDIGKSRINERILNKPGRLTTEEYEYIKHHARYGYDLLLHSGLPENLAAPAHAHHERMNGEGYPRRLKGHEIDLYSRIVSVADVFNAMTSRRVYRDAISYYKVLDELQQNAYGELDPGIVTLFVKKMTSFFVGNRVQLNDGTNGTVVHVPTDRPTRPLLQTNSGFIDLLHCSHLYIESVEAI